MQANMEGQAVVETKMSASAARLSMAVGFLRMYNPHEGVENALIPALQIFIDMAGLERGYVFLTEDDDSNMTEVARITPDEGEEDYQMSRSLIKECIASKDVVLKDALDINAEKTKTVINFNICTVMVIPIMIKDKVKAVYYVDKQLASKKLPVNLAFNAKMLADAIAIAMQREVKDEAELNPDECQQFLNQVVQQMDLIADNLGTLAGALDTHGSDDVLNGTVAQLADLKSITECLEAI